MGHVELQKMNEFFPQYSIYNDDYRSPISQKNYNFMNSILIK